MTYDYKADSDPHHWDNRTPLHHRMPRIFQLYQDLNDKKMRIFFSKLSGKILDAGCGEGRFTSYATVGVDFSKGMLRRAKRRNPQRSFICGSVLKLPFKDKSFSSVFTVDVINHIPPERRVQAVNELSRVAKHSYNFVAEQRTAIPTLLWYFRGVHSRVVRKMVSYLFCLFCIFARQVYTSRNPRIKHVCVSRLIRNNNNAIKG